MSTLSLTLSRTFDAAQKLLIIYLKNENGSYEAFLHAFISIQQCQIPHFQDNLLLDPESISEKLTEEGKKQLHYINLAKLTFFICHDTEHEVWLRDYFKLITGANKLSSEAVRLYLFIKLYLLRRVATPEDLADGLVTKIKSDSIEDLIPESANPRKSRRALNSYSTSVKTLSCLSPETQEQIGSFDGVNGALRLLVERRTRSWDLPDHTSAEGMEKDTICLVRAEEVDEEVHEEQEMMTEEEVYELESTDDESPVSASPASLLSSVAQTPAPPCPRRHAVWEDCELMLEGA